MLLSLLSLFTAAITSSNTVDINPWYLLLGLVGGIITAGAVVATVVITMRKAVADGLTTFAGLLQQDNSSLRQNLTTTEAQLEEVRQSREDLADEVRKLREEIKAYREELAQVKTDLEDCLKFRTQFIRNAVRKGKLDHDDTSGTSA